MLAILDLDSFKCKMHKNWKGSVPSIRTLMYGIFAVVEDSDAWELGQSSIVIVLVNLAPFIVNLDTGS